MKIFWCVIFDPKAWIIFGPTGIALGLIAGWQGIICALLGVIADDLYDNFSHHD